MRLTLQRRALALMALLATYKATCPGMKINVVTHSLGARVLLSALKCGGCCTNALMIQPAVDNECLEPGEEFGDEPGNPGPPGGTPGQCSGVMKVYYNDNDDVLGGAYVLSEWNSALGSGGCESGVEAVPNENVCQRNIEPKLKADGVPTPVAVSAGTGAPGVVVMVPRSANDPSLDPEDDHSGHYKSPSTMACVANDLNNN